MILNMGNHIDELEKVIEELKQKQKETPNLLRRDPSSLGVPGDAKCRRGSRGAHEEEF
jgi:hypothetical protein